MLRNTLDNQHDQNPEPRRIKHVLVLLDGLVDIQGDFFRRGPQRALGESRGHGGVDEAGFDGQHLYAAFVQAIAQALQEDAQGALGGAIDVVGLPATVAGH